MRQKFKTLEVRRNKCILYIIHLGPILCFFFFITFSIGSISIILELFMRRIVTRIILSYCYIIVMCTYTFIFLKNMCCCRAYSVGRKSPTGLSVYNFSPDLSHPPHRPFKCRRCTVDECSEFPQKPEECHIHKNGKILCQKCLERDSSGRKLLGTAELWSLFFICTFFYDII